MGQFPTLFALMAALLCCGCAGSGRTAASDAEQLASSNFMNCLDSAAHKLDDHSADVQSVGSVVSNACNWEAEALEKTFYQGWNPQDSELLLEKLPTAEARIRAAIEAVGRERAGQPFWDAPPQAGARGASAIGSPRAQALQ